jgi:hypothetical protein
LTILALFLAALAVAGCGGGSSDSTSAPATTAETSTLTKEELISRGDSICAEVNAAVGTVGESSEEGTSQVGQVADLYTGMIESLKGIGVPADAGGYSEFIAAGEELSQAESDAKLADERGDSTALGEAETSAVTALENFESEATSYGFKECGKEPSAPAAPTSTESTESAAPEEAEESVEPEAEVAPEEVEELAPETGGGAGTEAPPAGGGSSSGGSSGGVGPG